MDLYNLSKLEKDYIEQYSFLQNNANTIANNICINRKEIANYRNKTEVYTKYIQTIRNKYNNIKNKQNKFTNFKEFFDWFEKQEQECCFCKTSQNNLKQLFNQEILTSKKFNGTLHIERFDSNKPYSKSNCGLACAICNNAKSDFVSKEDFEKFFAPAIKKYLNNKIGKL